MYVFPPIQLKLVSIISCMHAWKGLSLFPSLSLPTVTVVEKVAHHDPCSPPEALSHVSLAAEKRVCIVVILLSLNKATRRKRRDEASIIKEFSRQWYNNRPSNCIYMYMCMTYMYTIIIVFSGIIMEKFESFSRQHRGFLKILSSCGKCSYNTLTPSLPPSLE